VADDWQPPPGMHKLLCQSCDRYFAAKKRSTQLCPTCQVRPLQRARRQSTTFETVSHGWRVPPKNIGGG